MRRAPSLALLSLLVIPVSAPEAAEPSTSLSPLATGISIAEVDEDDIEHPLQSKSDIYSIDINSSLWIKLDQATITSSLSRDTFARASKPLPPAVAEQRAQLIAALESLNAYLGVAARIAAQFQTFSTAEEIPGFQALVKQHGQDSKDLKAKVRLYMIAKAAAPGEVIQPDDELEKLFDGTLKIWTARLRDFLQNEIKRLDSQSEARVAEVKANSIPLKLQLSASLTRGGRRIERIHLPGYDSLKDGEYKPVDKISFAMAEEEKKKLQTEMAFNRDLAARLSETKSLKEGLTATLTKVFEEQAARIRQFLSETRITADSIAQIVSKTGTSSALDSPEIPAQARTDVQALLALLRESSGAVGVFRDETINLLPSETKLRAIGESDDPIEALDQLTKLTGELPLKGSAAFRDLDNKVTAIRSSMTVISSRLEQTIRTLPNESRSALSLEMSNWTDGISRVRTVVDAFSASSVTPLVGSLKNLKGQAGELKKADGALTLASGFDPRLVDDQTNLRSLDDLVDTKIVLPRTSRREGDQVEVLIIARPADAPAGEKEDVPPLAERDMIFNVKKFGAFSEFSSGAAAFFGTKATKEAEFGAMASFVVHRRSRSSKTWNLLNPGIGLHTAGITSGLGAGASLHLFPENFLQVGGGRTLRSGTTNDWYLFVGMRLFNFKLPTAGN